MSDSNRSRPVIDLDELERQLREASAPRAVAPAAPGREDPLAELARIVGQDDPYRSARPAVRPTAAAQQPRFEPSDFEAELAALSRGEPFTPRPAAAPQPPRPQAPSFEAAVNDAYAQPAPHEPVGGWDLRPSSQDGFQAPRGSQPETYAPAAAELEPHYEDEGQLPPHAEDYAEPPRRSRRGLYAVLVVMGVAVIGVSAGFAVRNSLSPTHVAGGAPPVIKAETGPSKVQPENPGGVEVANQDRQIFNKGVPEETKKAKMVGGEEQPIDVAAATRSGPRVILPPGDAATTGSATTSPAAPASSVELPKPPQTTSLPAGLGEPRKVKTVSVRPDGTIIDGASNPIGALAAAATADVGSTATASAAPAPTPRPRETPSATATAPKPVPTATATTTAAPPKPAAPRPVPTQVASTQPVAPVSEASDSAGGGWAVQLAAPPSEQEARDTASRLSKRFSGELAGMTPGVRKAEVSGKTIYRVRVGSLSRDDAVGLCEKLKAAGGQCFVAKN